MSDWQRQEWVDLMLDECETWAVIGLHDPRRTAYSIAELLQRKGKRIVPIHPLAEPVLGHRLIISPAARIRNVTAPTVMSDILNAVPVPGARAGRRYERDSAVTR